VASGVHVAGPEDVDAAVNAAQAAFEGWSGMSGQSRAACMLKLADLLEANAEKLGRLETLSMGAPKAFDKPMIGMATSMWRCESLVPGMLVCAVI
jgi:aldehyde dehydrogenase (NAD+)